MSILMKMLSLECFTFPTFVEIFAYVCFLRFIFTKLSLQIGQLGSLKKFSDGHGKALRISNLIVSGCFGLFASSSGIFVLYQRLTSHDWTERKTLTRNLKMKDDFLTRVMLASLAYFIYDLWAMFVVHTQTHGSLDTKESRTLSNQMNGHAVKTGVNQVLEDLVSYLRGRSLMIAHHLVLALVFIPIIIVRRDHKPGDVLIACTLILETSTPFVSLRAILAEMNLGKTWMYKLNGLLMVVAFFVFRIAIYPGFYLLYGLSVNLGFLQAVIEPPWYCSLGVVVSFIPQIYWFILMIKGAVKMLTSVERNLNKTD